MIMDLVFGDSRAFGSEGDNIGIVSVNEEADVEVFHKLGQQILGPKDTTRFACPGKFGVSIQTMNENDVDLSLRSR